MDWREGDDTFQLVLANYLKWKGEPEFVHQSEPDAQGAEHLSPRFAILNYASNLEYRVYCTVGASYKRMPGSEEAYGPQGVRFEYLLHAPHDFDSAVFKLLRIVSVWPFLKQFSYFSGDILAWDEPLIPGSHMQHLYFTYPYLDDPRVYDPAPCGQISLPNLLIQTLWVFPIRESEAQFIHEQEHAHGRGEGPQRFETLAYEKGLKAHDFFRPAII